MWKLTAFCLYTRPAVCIASFIRKYQTNCGVLHFTESDRSSGVFMISERATLTFPPAPPFLSQLPLAFPAFFSPFLYPSFSFFPLFPFPSLPLSPSFLSLSFPFYSLLNPPFFPSHFQPFLSPASPSSIAMVLLRTMPWLFACQRCILILVNNETSESDIGFFWPKNRNIGHRPFYPNRPNSSTTMMGT